jgi:mycofactocin precursor
MHDDAPGHDTVDTQRVADTSAQATAGDEQSEQLDDELVDELLIEEISIDGMCGVY